MYYSFDQIAGMGGMGDATPPTGEAKYVRPETAAIQRAAAAFDAARDQLSEARVKVGQWISRAQAIAASAPGGVAAGGAIAKLDEMRGAIEDAAVAVDQIESEHDATYNGLSKGRYFPFVGKLSSRWMPQHQDYLRQANDVVRKALAQVSPLTVENALAALESEAVRAQQQQQQSEAARIAAEEAQRRNEERAAAEDDRFWQQQEAARQAEAERQARIDELEAQRYHAEQERAARLEELQLQQLLADQQFKQQQQQWQQQQQQLMTQLELMSKFAPQGAQPALVTDPTTGQLTISLQQQAPAAPAAPAAGYSPYGPYVLPGAGYGYAAPPQPAAPSYQPAGSMFSAGGGGGWSPGPGEMFGMGGMGLYSGQAPDETDAEFFARMRASQEAEMSRRGVAVTGPGYTDPNDDAASVLASLSSGAGAPPAPPVAQRPGYGPAPAPAAGGGAIDALASLVDKLAPLGAKLAQSATGGGGAPPPPPRSSGGISLGTVAVGVGVAGLVYALASGGKRRR